MTLHGFGLQLNSQRRQRRRLHASNFKRFHMRPLTKISLFGIRLATCVLTVYWILLFTGTHLPSMPTGIPRVSDKWLHFSGFFGLTILLCWVISTRKSAVKKFLFIAALTLAYGAFDEISQGFVRGRVPDIRDFAADALGIFSAIALYATARVVYLKFLNAVPAVHSPAKPLVARDEAAVEAVARKTNSKRVCAESV